LIQESDCLALPSTERTEAFGLVLLEAMCYCKPVIASNIPDSGISWVIDHKTTGILTAPADQLSLATAMEQLASNRQMALEMGENGYQKYMAMFTISQVAKTIHGLYRRVLANKVATGL